MNLEDVCCIGNTLFASNGINVDGSISFGKHVTGIGISGKINVELGKNMYDNTTATIKRDCCILINAMRIGYSTNFIAGSQFVGSASVSVYELLKMANPSIGMKVSILYPSKDFGNVVVSCYIMLKNVKILWEAEAGVEVQQGDYAIQPNGEFRTFIDMSYEKYSRMRGNYQLDQLDGLQKSVYFDAENGIMLCSSNGVKPCELNLDQANGLLRVFMCYTFGNDSWNKCLHDLLSGNYDRVKVHVWKMGNVLSSLISCMFQYRNDGVMTVHAKTVSSENWTPGAGLTTADDCEGLAFQCMRLVELARGMNEADQHEYKHLNALAKLMSHFEFGISVMSSRSGHPGKKSDTLNGHAVFLALPILSVLQATPDNTLFQAYFKAYEGYLQELKETSSLDFTTMRTLETFKEKYASVENKMDPVFVECVEWTDAASIFEPSKYNPKDDELNAFMKQHASSLELLFKKKTNLSTFYVEISDFVLSQSSHLRHSPSLLKQNRAAVQLLFIPKTELNTSTRKCGASPDALRDGKYLVVNPMPFNEKEMDILRQEERRMMLHTIQATGVELMNPLQSQNYLNILEEICKFEKTLDKEESPDGARIEYMVPFGFFYNQPLAWEVIYDEFKELKTHPNVSISMHIKPVPEGIFQLNGDSPPHVGTALIYIIFTAK